MTNRAFRSVAALLSILLLTGVPTYAAPIVIRDVVQVLSNYQNSPDLRLRGVSQTSSSPASPLNIEEPDSLFAGVTIDQDPQKIDVIAQGDVEGTVCDCGDIFVAGGGWPKWPLLFLGAIPFFFIDEGCADCDTPSPTPTPRPPSVEPRSVPTPTPEPGSLLLFGTGLAAFGATLRRRYARSQLAARIRATKEEA
ncbi:MAG TPA: PEP-CTERM sorting domain-containing protein [Pyrinomonadaceae bacterium]|nr:PEP-CTERM sorting domain-containing protein [Pyrinomonadaceae bacterium]